MSLLVKSIGLVIATVGLGIYQNHKLEENGKIKNVNDSMARAETIFARFAHASKEERDQLTADLNSAFVSLKSLKTMSKEMQCVAVRMFYIYGKVLYGGPMDKSGDMFRTALTIKLLGMNLIGPEEYRKIKPHDVFSVMKMSDTLDAFTDKDRNTFTSNVALYSYIFNKSSKFLLQHNDSNVDALANDPQGYLIAQAIADQARANFNTDYYMVINPSTIGDVTNHFEKTYGLARRVFEKIAKETTDPKVAADSRWEVACIIYDSSRFFYQLKQGYPEKLNAKQVEESIATLDELKPYIDAENGSERAIGKEAQIFNISMILMDNLDPNDEIEKQNHLKKMYGLVCKALEFSDRTPSLSPFQRTLYKNNKASVALKCLKAGLEVAKSTEIGQLTGEVIKSVESDPYSHYYNVTFLLTGARYNALIGNPTEVERLVKLAEDVKDRCPKNKKKNQELIDAFAAEQKAASATAKK